MVLKRGNNVKYLPYVFTEHGAVMVANVLKSAPPRAQRVVTHHILASQLAKLASKVGKHDVELRRVFLTLRAILEPPPIRPKRTIGFIAGRA